MIKVSGTNIKHNKTEDKHITIELWRVMIRIFENRINDNIFLVTRLINILIVIKMYNGYLLICVRKIWKPYQKQ